jgi:hypothetical protein
MTGMNGAAYWPQHYEELRQRVWDLQAEIGQERGRIDMQQRNLTDALTQAFRKIDYCHARQTEADGRHEWLAGRVSTLEEQVTAAVRHLAGRPAAVALVPALAPPPPGLIASWTELVRAVGSLLPQLKELLAALAVLAAAIAAWGFVPEPSGSARTPPAIVSPSAP